MIIVKIWGGLGNQMFQYAAAKSLAIRTQQEIKVDLSFYKFVKDRSFSLQVFENDYKYADSKDIRSVLGILSYRVVLRAFKLLKKITGSVAMCYLDDPGFCYNRKFEAVKGDCFMDGYWQSYRYFEQYRQNILQLFTFKQAPGIPEGILDNIRQEESVSIHIRRGDYVSDKKNTAYHGVCDISYYQKAVQHIREKVKKPVFYIFSDDIDWVKENLVIEGECVYVSEINKLPEVDMQLMSLCRHNIIANSSFSWWGAWLNRNIDKIVVAPARWFAVDIDTRDLIPADWVRL